ncbi:glycosyltransferase family 4 protein [Sutcliffiella horikoshii]|uniref:glycosyltransferase family 4 protein n=1 Tax=Sutcliffiella horikoshii TaxID=79883 RepID=UPI001CFE8D65|nr:glycosyltransferase family 4 protein [Sutcliffiella horikoshii]
MSIIEPKKEFIRLIVGDDGDMKVEWVVHQWREDFVKVYQSLGEEGLNIRLIGWKGSSQVSRNDVFFLDIITEMNHGSISLPEYRKCKFIRAEIGVGRADRFFPFFESNTLKVEGMKRATETADLVWTPLRMIGKGKWQQLAAGYTYYEKPSSELQKARQFKSGTFQETVTSDVFYSVHSSHNLLLHEEIKYKYHIIMLSWECPPAVLGGLGQHVWQLSKQLAKAGHIVSLVTPHCLGAPETETVEGITVYRAKEVECTYDDFHLFVAQTNMNLVERVRNFPSNKKFTLIHAHDWLVGFAARALKGFMTLPLVSTIHALEQGRSNLEYPIQIQTAKWEESLIHNSDALIVCSSFMKREVENKIHGKKEVRVIPNGVSLLNEESDSVSDFLNRKSYTFLALFLGRMVPEKGITTLIDAAKKIHVTHPECLFILAGKGPYLSDYQALVCQAGLEKTILFVGYLNEREKATLLKRCDLLLVPSIYEPFGIVAIEGMAAAKPVIAARTGGLSSIIKDGESGLMFEPGDADDLSKKILSIIENPTLGAILGEMALNEVKQKYNWEDVRDQTEKVYETTVTTSSVQ